MIQNDERNADGLHPAARASAAETPTRVYHADRISVEWYADRCIGSGRCVRALPCVFDPDRRPWIDVSAADEDAISRAVLGCPSGALQLGRRATAPAEYESPSDTAGASAATRRAEPSDDDA